MAQQLQTKVEGDVIHIYMNVARLDASAATALKEQLQFTLDPAVKRAEVDLDGLKFIDSSGIGLLLSIYRKLPHEGAEVLLRNVDPAVLSVLELLRLHRIFKVA